MNQRVLFPIIWQIGGSNIILASIVNLACTSQGKQIIITIKLCHKLIKGVRDITTHHYTNYDIHSIIKLKIKVKPYVHHGAVHLMTLLLCFANSISTNYYNYGKVYATYHLTKEVLKTYVKVPFLLAIFL